MIVQVLLLVVGFALLVKGADFFVEGAAGIASKLGIPQLIIGLTIVAMGTSLPEAAVSITAGIEGNAGITVGNVVGSNIFNILVILGITALITHVKISKSTIRYEIPFVVLISFVLMFFGRSNQLITRYEGVVFWILFIFYFVYLFIMAKQHTPNDATEGKCISIWKCFVFILLGALMVIKGSDFAVLSASSIARYFGISERFIGLTIVAVGTSLPELVTSIMAARKGNAGIAIGNIIGSNIFNILFVIGTTSIFCDVPFEPKFLVDTLVSIVAAILLWMGTLKCRELRKPVGVIMLLTYACYFIYLMQF